MRAEMGVMPWGKHVFYPRMLHKARPQKVSDFLVDDDRWYRDWENANQATRELMAKMLKLYA